MQRLSLPHDELKAAYDAIVVGSGYGGGVAASRLARCGQRVAVIERGREWLTGEFPDRFPDLRRQLQVSGARGRTGAATGLYDVRVGEDIHVVVGCGLGGGSLINAGVSLTPRPHVFDDPAWPQALRGDGLLDEGFARARAMLRPAADPQAHDLAKVKALENASGALGVAPHAAEVATAFCDTVNAAGIEQPACTRCGDCCSGCNVGAKTTVALTYLPDARRHGAEIFCELEVTTLRKRDDGLWTVVCVPSGTPDKDRVSLTREVTARTVVLAGGTLGSTELLLRAREDGLAVSETLGTRFSANGDIVAFGYGAAQRVNAIGVGHPPKADTGPVGACVSGQICLTDPNQPGHEMYLQEGAMPSAVAPILPVLFLPDGRILGAAQSLLKGVYNGPFAHLQTFFIVSHDNAGGRIELRDGRLAVKWPGVAEQPVYARLDRVLEATVTANGGRYIKNPMSGTLLGGNPATTHPLGGCGMGEARDTGVVNHKCQVFNGSEGAAPGAVHDGLYVCDGAAIPCSLGVNPLLTITGLAERAMLLMARDRGWPLDTAPVAAPTGKAASALTAAE